MKINLILVTIFVFFSFSSLTIGNENLANAFDAIVKYLLVSNREITVFNFFENKNDFDEFMLKILQNELFPFKIVNRNKTYGKADVLDSLTHNTKKAKIRIKESAILLFDSVEDLKAFNGITRLNDLTPNQIKLYSFCKSGTYSDILTVSETNKGYRNNRRKIFDYFNDMNDILQYQYYLVDENKSINLLTFVWYTNRSCKDSQLIEVNRFEKVEQRWSNFQFSLEKNKNFHGCQLVFGMKHSANEFYWIENLESYMKPQGSVVEIVKFLSEKLNFTYVFNPVVTGDRKDSQLKIENRFKHDYLYKNMTIDLLL